MRKMIIASTSTVYGSDYLAYLFPELRIFLKNVKTVLFIPYARPSGISYDEYTRIVKNAFAKISKDVVGIHQFENPKQAIQQAEAIFIGGGNTFELINQLYKNEVLFTLKTAIDDGTPYIGTSAGGNICGVSMMNTNDMPIVYPPSFFTLGCLPFNINAHYVDPISNSTHMGETRETRIKEFHVFNDIPVLGMREGSWLKVEGSTIKLKGNFTARWFQAGKVPVEIESESEFGS